MWDDFVIQYELPLGILDDVTGQPDNALHPYASVIPRIEYHRVATRGKPWESASVEENAGSRRDRG
jgi:hypothetical protein